MCSSQWSSWDFTNIFSRMHRPTCIFTGGPRFFNSPFSEKLSSRWSNQAGIIVVIVGQVARCPGIIKTPKSCRLTRNLINYQNIDYHIHGYNTFIEFTNFSLRMKASSMMLSSCSLKSSRSCTMLLSFSGSKTMLEPCFWSKRKSKREGYNIYKTLKELCHVQWLLSFS